VGYSKNGKNKSEQERRICVGTWLEYLCGAVIVVVMVVIVVIVERDMAIAIEAM
jgi:hypothetical protein